MFNTILHTCCFNSWWSFQPKQKVDYQKLQSSRSHSISLAMLMKWSSTYSVYQYSCVPIPVALYSRRSKYFIELQLHFIYSPDMPTIPFKDFSNEVSYTSRPLYHSKKTYKGIGISRKQMLDVLFKCKVCIPQNFRQVFVMLVFYRVKVLSSQEGPDSGNIHLIQ